MSPYEIVEFLNDKCENIGSDHIKFKYVLSDNDRSINLYFSDCRNPENKLECPVMSWPNESEFLECGGLWVSIFEFCRNMIRNFYDKQFSIGLRKFYNLKCLNENDLCFLKLMGGSKNLKELEMKMNLMGY